jgi:hypothetical protein
MEDFKVASLKQVEANRLNAKNAGVKTEAGKAKIRFNALKHGLSSKNILTESKFILENAETYNEMLEGLTDSLGPRNFFEHSIVDQMARALFKFQRYECLEARALAEDWSVSDILSMGPESKADKLTTALRYKAAIETQFYKAYSALLLARSPKQLDLFVQSEVIVES